MLKHLLLTTVLLIQCILKIVLVIAMKSLRMIMMQLKKASNEALISQLVYVFLISMMLSI